MSDDAGVAPDQSRLRALHLAPNAPVVDVYLDDGDEPAFASLEFTRGTRYAILDRGAHDVAITAEGAPAADAVIRADGIDLEGATSYTAVAFGPNNDLGALLLEDLPAPRDGATVRIAHVAVGVGQVDVWAVADDGELTALVEDLDYGSAADPLDVPAGVHTIGLDLDDDRATDLTFALPELPEGSSANLFAATDAVGAPFVLAQLASEGVTVRVDPEATEPEGPTSGNAWVRTLHLSPDAPNVDVFVDDGAEPAFADLPFGWGTGYAELPADAYRIRVSATGTRAEDAVIDAADVALGDGTATTIVAYGSLASIGALVLDDDLRDVAPGTIRIRAVHAAEGVGQVDIYAYGPDGSANRIYDDVDFGSAGDALDVPAVQYTIGLDLNDDALPELRFDLPGLASGTVANVFAVADAEGSPFLLAQLRDGNTLRIDPSTRPVEQGRVRVVHFSPDAPNVDVTVNGADAPIVADLPFGSGTAFASLPAGTYDVAVSAAGTPASSAILSFEGLEIAAGASYTVAAFDDLATIQGLLLEDDFSPVPAGRFRFRVVHTAIGIGNVDVIDLTSGGIPPVLEDDILLGTAGPYTELPVGHYTLGIDLNDDRVPEARYEIPHLPAGTIANVFAVAELDAAYLVAQLEDGSTLRIDPS